MKHLRDNTIESEGRLEVIVIKGQKLKEFPLSTQNGLLERCTMVCEINNQTFNPDKDKLVMIRYKSEDLNFDTHGINQVFKIAVPDDDVIQIKNATVISIWIPKKLIEGYKEGTVIPLKLLGLHYDIYEVATYNRNNVFIIDTMACLRKLY